MEYNNIQGWIFKFYDQAESIRSRPESIRSLLEVYDDWREVYRILYTILSGKYTIILLFLSKMKDV